MSTKGTTTEVTVGSVTVTGTWVGTDDLVVGETLVVTGPAAGSGWMSDNRVAAVKLVEVLNDRTNTRVALSSDDLSDPDTGGFGNWSRMTFLTVPGSAVPC